MRLSVDVFLIKYLTHCYFAQITWRHIITSTLKRHRHYHIWQIVQRCINMGRPFFWRHLPVPAWTIDLELRATGNSAGSLTPPSCTPQNHSVPLITRCLNLPHVTSQYNVARDWVRYAPFCFCCDSRGRKWGPQHHRFITGPPTPPTKRQNGGLLSYIARWYISSVMTYGSKADSQAFARKRRNLHCDAHVAAQKKGTWPLKTNARAISL